MDVHLYSAMTTPFHREPAITAVLSLYWSFVADNVRVTQFLQRQRLADALIVDILESRIFCHKAAVVDEVVVFGWCVHCVVHFFDHGHAFFIQAK